jgi:hypothetical protein
VFLTGDGTDETSTGNRPGKGETMTQIALLWYLVIVLALCIILATMFITYKRIGRWRQTEEHKAKNEPVVGTQRGPPAGREQIHSRANTAPLDEDVGGNLARVPREKNDLRDPPDHP